MHRRQRRLTSAAWSNPYNAVMPTKRKTPAPERWYRGANIPMRVIRRFARDVAERFQPEKIILFGSYAYGTPHDDSDVDILVVMPARNQIDKAVQIDWAIDAQFPVDLIVRTPKKLAQRLKDGDQFLREITTQGKVLYEKADARVGEKSRERLSTGRKARARKGAVS
jgi:uncharacterized protein